MKENEKIEKETETGEKKPAPKKEPSKKPAKSKAVSYTHLDVYKRQLYQRICGDAREKGLFHRL